MTGDPDPPETWVGQPFKETEVAPLGNMTPAEFALKSELPFGGSRIVHGCAASTLPIACATQSWGDSPAARALALTASTTSGLSGTSRKM